MKIFLLILGMAVWTCWAQRRPPNYAQSNMPRTSFSCRDKIIGGYYADPETDCQMFHVCVKIPGRGVQDFRFLCPNDTSFDQENQICDDWYNIDCEASTLYYSDNFDLYRIGGDIGKVGAIGKVSSYSVNNAVSDPDDDLYLQKADRGESVSNDLLRGSHSGNFFSNKNRGREYDEETKEYSGKSDKKQVRKLLTGKRPIESTSTTVSSTQAQVTEKSALFKENQLRNRNSNFNRNVHRTTVTTPSTTFATEAPTTARARNFAQRNFFRKQQTAAPQVPIQQTSQAPVQHQTHQPPNNQYNGFNQNFQNQQNHQNQQNYQNQHQNFHGQQQNQVNHHANHNQQNQFQNQQPNLHSQQNYQNPQNFQSSKQPARNYNNFPAVTTLRSAGPTVSQNTPKPFQNQFVSTQTPFQNQYVSTTQKPFQNQHISSTPKQFPNQFVSTTQKPFQNQYVSTTQKPFQHVSTTQKPHSQNVFTTPVQSQNFNQNFVSSTQPPVVHQTYYTQTQRVWQTTFPPQNFNTFPSSTNQNTYRPQNTFTPQNTYTQNTFPPQEAFQAAALSNNPGYVPDVAKTGVVTTVRPVTYQGNYSPRTSAKPYVDAQAYRNENSAVDNNYQTQRLFKINLGRPNYDDSQDEFLKTAHSQNLGASRLNKIQQQQSRGYNTTVAASYNFIGNDATTKLVTKPSKATTIKPVTAYPSTTTTLSTPSTTSDYDYAYYDNGNPAEYENLELDFRKTTPKKQ